MRTSYLIDAVALVVGALVMGVAFWSLGKTDPMWAIISFVLVYDPEARVLKTACLRLGGTIAGSALAIGVLAICGVEKWALPAGIAAAAVLCGIFQMPRPVLRVVLVTVALIIGSAILEASLGPYIAVARSIEVTAGSLLAVVFSWGVGRLGGAGRGMRRVLAAAVLPVALPWIVKWARRQEAEIVLCGAPLAWRNLEDAREMGVERPEKIRLMKVGEVPLPASRLLRALGRLAGIGSPAGMTLGYGVYLRSEFWMDRHIIAHECVHVGQYERMGMKSFLSAYLAQCLVEGYLSAPLEVEAMMRSAGIFG